MSRPGALALITALLLFPPAATVAGDNPNFNIPLHAKVGGPEGCDGYRPVDCGRVWPTVDVPANVQITAFVLIYDYWNTQGVQTAFDWDPGWTLLGGACDCQPGQTCQGPWEFPGGNLATAFLCIYGPAIRPVARMFFITGSNGCLRQVQSSYPFGIHMLDCQNGIDRINPLNPAEAYRLGRICVGQGGHAACGFVSPAEARTWGAIKAAYQ